MVIDWNTIDRTKLKTFSGAAVRIYATDGAWGYPIHGASNDGVNGWESQIWTNEGLYMENGRQFSPSSLDFTAALPTEPTGNAEGLS